MQSAQQLIGYRKEQAACDYLQKNGLSLIQKNFRCRFGEIDLIMQEGEYIVFVEVRFRNATNYGESIETLSHAKRNRLTKTALTYLQEQNLLEKMPCRFDVIGSHQDQQINWIKNAFDVHY